MPCPSIIDSGSGENFPQHRSYAKCQPRASYISSMSNGVSRAFACAYACPVRYLCGNCAPCIRCSCYRDRHLKKSVVARWPIVVLSSKPADCCWSQSALLAAPSVESGHLRSLCLAQCKRICHYKSRTALLKCWSHYIDPCRYSRSWRRVRFHTCRCPWYREKLK